MAVEGKVGVPVEARQLSCLEVAPGTLHPRSQVLVGLLAPLCLGIEVICISLPEK